MYVGVLTYSSASGGGKFSVDEKVFGRELEIYNKALCKVSNKRSKWLRKRMLLSRCHGSFFKFNVLFKYRRH